MVTKTLSLVILAILLLAHPISAFELNQYSGSDDASVDAVTAATREAGDRSAWGPQLHRISGYATMAGALLTGVLGWINPNSLHETAAWATTGLAVVTTGVGAVAYARDASTPLGHVILSGIGTVGFAANLFIEPEDGSGEIHRWLGTGATAAFALSVGWVLVY